MADADFEVEETPGYKAPAKVGLEEMKNKDADDEALNRWKAKLLEGQATAKSDDPRLVVPLEFQVIVQGRDTVVIDLSKGGALKDQTITMKEGSEFKLGIKFKVQNDVVSGLKYVHAVYRKGIRVTKDTHMMGSFGPKEEPNNFTSPLEDVPSGMLARGTYTIKGKLLDDDKNEHFAFETKMDIKKGWAE
eukprot:m.256252 g.256252  ORF g.256252 m.256252 type:complete len:190 (+) comp34197_c0_seq1:106-675(+)